MKKLSRTIRNFKQFYPIIIIGFILLLVSVFASGKGSAAVDDLELDKPGIAKNFEKVKNVWLLQDTPINLYLPLVQSDYPWASPFGFETTRIMTEQNTLLAKADELGSNWVRLNLRISWRELQPNEGDPIDWDSMKLFENELRAINEMGMTAVVIISDHPYWAVKPYLSSGELIYSSCAAVKSEKIGAFAYFMRQVVERYSIPPYGVHHWELGNEPDVDPRLVPLDMQFGCWGEIEDPYYGGRHYGEMLKVVTPAIKAVDPTAKVWVGGLLLNSPNTTDPTKGRPELFLQGILEAGAGESFDIVGYHSYPGYTGERIDYDLSATWLPWGGNTLGKTRFLRSIMAQYGINKPVFLNETGLTCPENPPHDAYCLPPDGIFYQAQADFLVRIFTRGFDENIMGFIWYTLNGDGWRYTGLLDHMQAPKPAYIAYQELIAQLKNTEYIGKVDYGIGLESYGFQADSYNVHVLWAVQNETFVVRIPVTSLVEAYDQYGNELSKIQVGENYQIQVGFSPIYLILDS